MHQAKELLNYKKTFDGYLGQRQHQLSGYHFSSIFLWKDFFDFTFEEMDGQLCVWAKYALGTFLYFPPVGRGLSGPLIDQCFSRLNSNNSKKAVGRIENVSDSELSMFDQNKYRSTLRSNEYWYLKEDIQGLRGNAYKAKRASYNQFINNYSYEFVPFHSRWADDCLKLYDLWAQNRSEASSDGVYRAMLEENRGVHSLIFQYCDDLGLTGRVVLVDGRVQGYTFGYPLNNETFCVLVEIVNLSFKGLSVFIFSGFCADEALKDFKYINTMDDFAMANVARTKESFRPASLIPSYIIVER